MARRGLCSDIAGGLFKHYAAGGDNRVSATNEKTKHMNNRMDLTVLGNKVTQFTKLETFPTPSCLQQVTCTSDEVTAICPVTGQPDWYTVKVEYRPDKLCVESKSLKLYLQSFRNAGHFCEAFADLLCQQLFSELTPHYLRVTVTQKPRGGISIESVSERQGL
jgi:7-cyano-7-deazaguanine reductase